MAKTPSTMPPLGMKAPAFRLPDTTGRLVTLDDFRGSKGLVVAFICNHCPYVVHIRDELARFARDAHEKGIAVVGINSNDVQAHPDDRPEKMVEEVRAVGYTFPYVFDETQEVAKAYQAACTPDLYLFDAELRLVYRGQFDESRPKRGVPVTGQDLRAAVEALLAGRSIPEAEQRPSLGCNVKWKPGNEPEYFPTR